MPGGRTQGPICSSHGNYVDPGTLSLQLTPQPGLLGGPLHGLQLDIPCLHLDLPTPPQPVEQSTDAAPQTPSQQPRQGTLRDDVETILNANHFDVPLVVDDKHAFYNGQRLTLDQITDNVLAQVGSGTNRPEVLAAVGQVYNAMKAKKEDDLWQTNIQVLYTPQYTFLASSLQPSPWQNSFQASVGRNYRSHLYGRPGWEHTLQLTGSFFNVGSGNLDLFQNALLSYQASYVTPIGSEFRFLGIPELWSYVQGSVFAQVAAGVGSSYDTDGTGVRRLYAGFLVQPSAGGQLTVNIGWLQLIVQGSLAYSWLSSTTQPGSKPTWNLGSQLGLGVGAQF